MRQDVVAASQHLLVYAEVAEVAEVVKVVEAAVALAAEGKKIKMVGGDEHPLSLHFKIVAPKDFLLLVVGVLP